MRQSEINKLEWLRSRRSVRHFQSRAVPEDVIRLIIDTANYAPSAHNRQPWRFVVMTSQETRERFALALGAEFRLALQADEYPEEQVEARVSRSYKRIVNSPAAILLCLDSSQGDPYPDAARQHLENLMGVQSCALAGGYLLLAAHALGLAGVWMCAPLFSAQTASTTLDLPESWQPQALILIGYPVKNPPPPERKSFHQVALIR